MSWRTLPWVPDRRPIYEWAADNVTLPPVLTKSGPFDWRDSRHFCGPLEALQSDLVREVNICAPTRSGKTLIADLWVPWMIANDPAGILWVFDVENSAKLHCETRLIPTLQSVAQVNAMMPIDRHKSRAQSIQFSNGLPLHVTGPAIANLQARGYRAVICDEAWNWPPSRMGEAKARMGDFAKVESNKFLCISQGGSDRDEWHAQFATGEVNEWHVPCASCGHMQPMAWTGKRDDKSRWGVIYDAEPRKDGTYDTDKAGATARFACRKCGHEHPDTSATRSRWNLHGAYIHLGVPIRSRKSFTFTAMVDTPMAHLVEEWLKCQYEKKENGFYIPTVQFIQKRLAQWATTSGVMAADNPVETVEFNPSVEWPDEVARVMTVDVQTDDKFYVLVCAWSRKECRRLHWAEVFGASAVEEVRVKFNVPSARTFCDCGHVRKEAWNIRRTYQFIAQYGWLGVAGRTARQFIHTDAAGKQVAKPWSPQWWGDPMEGQQVKKRTGNKLARCVHSAFDVVALRTLGLMENGWFKDPAVDQDEIEIDYRAQLNAEKLLSRPNKTTNRPEKYWRVSGPNHALDCRRMQTLAAMMIGIL